MWAPRQGPRASGNILWGGSWTVTTSRPTQTACSSAASWPPSPPSTWRAPPRLQLQPTSLHLQAHVLNQVWTLIRNIMGSSREERPLWHITMKMETRCTAADFFSFAAARHHHQYHHPPPPTNTTTHQQHPVFSQLWHDVDNIYLCCTCLCFVSE